VEPFRFVYGTVLDFLFQQFFENPFLVCNIHVWCFWHQAT